MDKLSTAISAPVFDDTGIDGSFDISLNIQPFIDPLFFDRTTGTPREQLHPLLLSAAENAIQVQLGLKLERRKVPTKLILIDHFEAPRSIAKMNSRERTTS